MSERTERLNEPDGAVVRLLKALDRHNVPRVSRAEFIRMLLEERGDRPIPAYVPERDPRG